MPSWIQFSKVGDLIDWLETLGRDRDLIHDVDGSTDVVFEDDIDIWNENDPESPVAIFHKQITDRF